MNKYYCDGSCSKKLGLIGMGIIANEHPFYYELKNDDWVGQPHEIEAMIRTIEIAASNGDYKFTLVNDDRNTVRTLNKLIRGRFQYGKTRSNRYKHLLSLLKKYKVKLIIPEGEDKKYIKQCDVLSRSYLNDSIQG